MNEHQMLQKSTYVNEENVLIKRIILGDSAYKIRSWLLPPYPRFSNIPRSQIEFNVQHCKGHEVVERAYGQLKG